ncbi:MAG: hypothetical protein KA974_11310 [Saprospiraceae bacterium]|nr:hypothetical protein [Saprospiraceae bacterium]
MKCEIDFKNEWKNEAKIFYRLLAIAVFATLTPHRQPIATKWLRHFTAAHPPPKNKRTQGSNNI